MKLCDMHNGKQMEKIIMLDIRLNKYIGQMYIFKGQQIIQFHCYGIHFQVISQESNL